MPLYYNNQKFSDKEVADAIKAKKQERRQWCEQQAREHLAQKPRRKFYRCTYFVPEVEMQKYIALPSEQEEQLRAVMNQQIADGFDPDLSDTLQEMAIPVYEDDGPEGVLTDIDFDDFIYCYSFRVKRFDHEGNEVSDDNLIARLTDDEYIQVLTELLYAPRQLSFDGLRIALPEIGTKILNDVTSPFETSAIFMTVFNADVDAILKPIGGRDHIPGAGLFGNPFVAIAEHNAAKE